MKKHYILSGLGLFMALTTTLAQPLRQGETPGEPPALRARKATAPFVGITVNVPLWKIFGTKKAKVLPQLPKAEVAPFYVEERLPVVPEPMNSEMEWDTTGLVVSYESMYDLDPVTVTAPRLPGYGGGGSAPGGGVTGGGEPLPPIQQNPVGDPPSGNYVPPTEEELLQNCRQCKADARATLHAAQEKYGRAQAIFEQEKQAANSYVYGNTSVCVVSAFGVGYGIGMYGARFAVTWLGAVIVVAAAVGGTSLTYFLCLKAVVDEGNLRLAKAENDWRNASDENDAAIRLFNNTIATCGSCP